MEMGLFSKIDLKYKILSLLVVFAIFACYFIYTSLKREEKC